MEDNQILPNETEEGQEVDATLRKAIPIPSFLPPLKLQTVISKNYIDVWYQTKQAILNADKIVVLGCSFTTPDSFFCDILRENRDAKIVVIDKNIEAVASNVCRILQLPSNRYTKQLIGQVLNGSVKSDETLGCLEEKAYLCNQY